MKRYEVVVGRHCTKTPGFKTRHEDGKYDPREPGATTTHLTGAVIESDKDLLQLFPGKFRLVQEAPTVVVTPARRLAVTSMIQEGSYDEEDRGFLESLTEDGFARVQKAGSKPVATQPTSGASILGENVTNQFVRAYDEGFEVWINPKKKYNVTTRTDVNKPLNNDPLNKADVDKFVDDHLKVK